VSVVPKILRARTATDEVEETKIDQLARSRHAPGDWILRARIIQSSWEGLRVPEIAEKLGCHQKTVRKWLSRFGLAGVDGLADLPGVGRKRRITEAERSRIIALVKTDPPGRLMRQADGKLEAADESKPPVWTLDALTEAAQAAGIEVHRSQVRTILLAEGVRWRRTHSWMRSKDPDFAPKEPGSSVSIPTHRRRPRLSAPTSWAR
jgi:transposase